MLNGGVRWKIFQRVIIEYKAIFSQVAKPRMEILFALITIKIKIVYVIKDQTNCYFR